MSPSAFFVRMAIEWTELKHALGACLNLSRKEVVLGPALTPYVLKFNSNDIILQPSAISIITFVFNKTSLLLLQSFVKYVGCPII